MEAHKMLTSTGTRSVEQMFNEACRELRLTKEALIRKAYAWYFRGKCKTKRMLRIAVKQFNELHTFPSFVVDYLNDHFKVKPA